MAAFGELNGEQITRHVISNGQLTANILNYGAIVQNLRLASVAHPLVLGFESVEPYDQCSPYFGAMVGRCANRIRGGDLPLDGEHWQLDLNERGCNHLHGGSAGLSKRIWQVLSHDVCSIELGIVCAHGEMGYPGNLTIRCRIFIEDPARLCIEVTAETDAVTLCNLAHHSYFNLDASPTVTNHQLQLMADRYLPVDAESIPTGEIAEIAGTELDFRVRRRIGFSAQARDHNICLADQPRALSHAALLAGESGVQMDVYTTEPGLQLYVGDKLDVPEPGLGGRHYGRNAGLCLEPQRWPDSIHHPAFAGAVLQPRERYFQLTEYRFRDR